MWKHHQRGDDDEDEAANYTNEEVVDLAKESWRVKYVQVV